MISSWWRRWRDGLVAFGPGFQARWCGAEGSATRGGGA
jgi:hypothetical protein